MASTSWAVAVGQQITASILDPPGGLEDQLGARVESPVVREIVSYWRPTELDNGVHSVTLDGVVEAGSYQFVWITDREYPGGHEYRGPAREPGTAVEYELFIPLNVMLPPMPPTAGWPDGGGSATSIGGGGYTDTTEYPPVDWDEVRPTVDDVARLERTRTFHDDGTEVETFDDKTRPTAGEVDLLIDQAMEHVQGALPAVFDGVFYGTTKQLIALYCAMLIEGSWFKEQHLARATLPWEVEYNAALRNLLEKLSAASQQANVLGGMEPWQPGSLPRRMLPEPWIPSGGWGS